MKNEDLLKLKIDIGAEDDRIFQEIALLVDKPSFLQLVSSLRKTYLIETLYNPKTFEEDYRKLLREGSEVQVELNIKKYKRIKEYETVNGAQYDRLMTLNKYHKKLDWASAWITELSLICFEFRRPLTFRDVIERAVFCGKVDEDEYVTTSTYVTDPYSAPSWEDHLPEVVISVTPNTTYEEVKAQIPIAKKLIRLELKDFYYKKSRFNKGDIKQYRQWYWERVAGKTYASIADKYSTEYKTLDEGMVLDGISSYKKRLLTNKY